MDDQNLMEAQTAAAVGVLAGKEIAETTARMSATILRFEDGRPYRIKGDGNIELVDYLLSGPSRRAGSVAVYTSESFSAYVNRFKDSTSLVFSDVIARKFTGVLSYFPEGSDAGAGEWDVHRVELALRHTPDWDTWAKSNKTEMDQATFAQFLEDNIPNIAEPDAALLVQIARTLEAKVNATFESDIRPDNGSYAFKYAEDVQSQAGRGTIQIPNEIVLALAPFEGSPLYRVKARFRHKLRSGKLTLWYDMIRVEDVIRTAFGEELRKIHDAINAAEMETPILHGPAPAKA